MSAAAKIQAFLNAPASLPPPGVKAHIDHGENQNDAVLALLIISIALTTIALIARIYSRAFVSKQLHIEDYFSIVAFLATIVLYWCIIDYSNNIGFFVHQWDLRGRMHITFGLSTYALSISYAVGMFFLKSAILLEWQRLFAMSRTNRILFFISTALIVITMIFYISVLFVSIFTCKPIEKVWHPWVVGKCIDRRKRDLTTSSMNLMLDIFIFLLPQKLIWRLNMNWQRRIGLAIVFSVGLLVLVSASGRLYATATAEYGLSTHSDLTYKYSKLLLWAFCEFPCMFLVFCVPAFPKLFSENSKISHLLSSMRTWVRMSSWSSRSSPRQTPTSSKPWPRTIGSVSRWRNYRRTEDGTMDSIAELAMMHGGRREERPSNEEMKTASEKDEHGGGILKTFQVDTQNDTYSARSGDSIPHHTRQHPWMGT